MNQFQLYKVIFKSDTIRLEWIFLSTLSEVMRHINLVSKKKKLAFVHDARFALACKARDIKQLANEYTP